MKEKEVNKTTTSKNKKTTKKTQNIVVEETKKEETTPIVEPITKEESVKETKPNKSPKFIIIIIICLLLLTGLGIFLWTKSDDNKNNEDETKEEIKDQDKEQDKEDKPSTPDAKPEPEKKLEPQTAYDQIIADLNNKKIDVKEAFNQLVYLKYDSKRLNSKYKNAPVKYMPGCGDYAEKILANFQKELDPETVKFYAINMLGGNIHFGKKDEAKVEKTTNNQKEYKVQLLADDKEKASNHNLDKVILSENGNFLVWYTNTGEDGITDEQAKDIAKGMEKSSKSYEEIFGIKFKIDLYIDNKMLSDEWDNAKDLLEENKISKDKINTAMGIYVYDTGSEGVLAQHITYPRIGLILNDIFSQYDSDGIMCYPYIQINKRGFKTLETLQQVYNHELFHYFQYLYFRQFDKKDHISDLRIGEGMANLASALVSDSKATNNFLNNWSSIYKNNTLFTLKNIADARGSKGYALFTFYNSYLNNVKDGAKKLMDAHKEEDVFKYLQEQATKEELAKVMKQLAIKTLADNYDKKGFNSNEGKIRITNKLTSKKEYPFTASSGAINYFKPTKDSDWEVSTKGEYMIFMLLGEKNNDYKIIKSNNKSLTINKEVLKNYDNFYLVAINSQINNQSSYIINVKNGNVTPEEKPNTDEKFVTSFKNYNLNIITKTTLAGNTIEMRSYGKMDELHQKEYLKSVTETMGIKIEIDTYQDFKTGYTYSNQPFKKDEWVKDKTVSQMVDLNKIVNKMINMENTERVSAHKYKVKLTPSDVAGLVEQNGNQTSILEGPVYVNVTVMDGYITNLYYDFSSAIPSFDKYTIDVTISNYNQAGDVIIPESIINIAK